MEVQNSRGNSRREDCRLSMLQEIFDKLRENEKEVLIRSSGSTRGGGSEKIRSGQSYLYKLRGMESEVLEVRFTENVRGAALNQALGETMRRYPYFCTKILEKDGDFYIVQNELAPVARKTRRLPALGSIDCGYRLVDVTYFGKSVFISFHHALCDGRGIKPFAETLVWYYCKFRYGENGAVEGVRLAGEPFLPGETAEPFLSPYNCDKNKQFISLSRDAFALPEEEQKGDCRYEVSMPSAAFMGACKRENATPAILVSMMMSGGIADLYPYFDKPINANIAADIRAALNCPNTFKNCVRSMILPYGHGAEKLPSRELATEYRKLLKEQQDFDYCRREANAMLALFDKLDTLPSYEEKREIMSFFEGMLLNTYVVSYLGQLVLGGNARYVASAHLYNSGTAGLGINMIACGDTFSLDFKQSFFSDKYVRAFLARAEKFGILYTVSEAIPFSTPTDKLLKRRGVQEQG